MEARSSLFTSFVCSAGLTESIIAAAASRIGKSVLHLDSNDFYGGYWASFNLENIKTVRETSISGTECIQVNRKKQQVDKLRDQLSFRTFLGT